MSMNRDRSPHLIALFAVPLLAAAMAVVTQAASAQAPAIPENWQPAWDNPPLDDRPLQIVHGIHPNFASADGLEQILQQPGRQPDDDQGMAYYLRRGRGGIVCNVAFDNYLESEENWQTLVAGVDACAKLGMTVWLYDEKGYPSGAAGGLVLRGSPDYEALVWAFDPSRSGDPFILRRAFEHTHAANNYHAVRRYVNLLDDRATRKFINVTHEQYRRRVGEHFGKTIVAFFTDEPSLMPVNLGPIPEPARSRVPVEDEPDPNVKPLPTVPWCYDLAEQYRKRYGEDLLEQRFSLFAGDSAEDRRVRRQYWCLIGDLVAARYFGQIQDWCHENNLASSGHNLAEESLIHHIPLYGNGLKAISRMDIPGLDMLSSDPQVVVPIGWLTAAMPLSGALLQGNRRVMTEVSDFQQKMGGQGPVDLDAMRATAAWQACWGVTEFTLYYSPEDRSVDDNWQYGQFVGRLNSVLKPAMPQREVGVYYPASDLAAEYRPVAERLTAESQTERARAIVHSFHRVGHALQWRQIPFLLIDHGFLAQAKVTGDGRLSIGNARLHTLIVPEHCELPQAAADVLDQFTEEGGRVIRDQRPEPVTPENIAELTAAPYVFHPAENALCCGRFTRDGRKILLVVNTGGADYTGRIGGIDQPGGWLQLDPQTGAAAAPEEHSDGGAVLKLSSHESVLLVGPED